MNGTTLQMYATYDSSNDVTLATGNFKKFLATIPNNEAQLIVTSPPYQVGKEYEEEMSEGEYRRMLKDVVKECVRIVKPGGSICFQTGNYMAGPNRPKPLPFLVDPIFRRYESKEHIYLRNMIIWHFGHGLHATRRFSGRYETILWYTKGGDYYFDLEAVRVPQKYPGKRHYRGAKKGQPSGNPAGKNPSDVWLDVPNVKANHVEKTDHPCQFPIGLVERLILALTKPGDLVVDPFMGVGSTAAAAVLTGRRAAGSDLNSRYIDEARDRVRRAYAGKLPVRPNRPVYQPTGSETVARVPEGFWMNFVPSGGGE